MKTVKLVIWIRGEEHPVTFTNTVKNKKEFSKWIAQQLGGKWITLDIDGGVRFINNQYVESVDLSFIDQDETK